MFIQHFHGVSVSQRDDCAWWRLLLGTCKRFQQIKLRRCRLGCAVGRVGTPDGVPVTNGGPAARPVAHPASAASAMVRAVGDFVS